MDYVERRPGLYVAGHHAMAMRAVFLPALLFLALPAQGQPLATPTTPEGDRLSPGQRRAVTAAGALGGVALSAAVVAASSATGDGWGNEADAVVLVVAYGTGVLLATRLAGATYGGRAPWGDSVRDVVLGLPAGALAGVVAGGVAGGGVYALQLATGSAGDYNFIPAITAVVVGVPTALWVSSRVASRSLRITPAMGAAPTGERAVGLRLRVRL